MKKIEKNKVVSMAYSISDKQGRVLEVRSPEDPVEFLVGSGQILEGLEEQIMGETPGFMGQFEFEPEQAHGRYRADLVVQMPKSHFPEEMELKKGMKFESVGPDGTPIALHIIDIQGNHVIVDGNHPLAGETLKFDIRILDIRNAAEEEIYRGKALSDIEPASSTKH